MTSSIFHPGDLNSGITRAIQEQKLVVCFVRDDDEQSTTWDTLWLGGATLDDEEVSFGQRLSHRAVLLRIDAGSKEAGFLNAFCPISTVPLMAVIHNGQVLEKIESGIEKEEFIARLSDAVGLDSHTARHQTQAPEQGREIVDASVQGASTTSEAQSSSTSNAPASASTAVPAASSPETSVPSHVQEMYNDRAKRLMEDHKKRQEAEQLERKAKADARRKEAEEASTTHADKGKQRASTEQMEKQKARDAWIYQQKQRKEEARKDRERILHQIEVDKQERRAKVQRAKEADQSGGGGASSGLRGVEADAPKSRAGDLCLLQVRLFDGSSIRSKFPSDATLSSTVRKWIKEASVDNGSSQPYTFKHILAPQPSRSIEVNEEHKSLQEIGLVPSATLVLVPVSGSVDAYSSAGHGYVGAPLHFLYSIFMTLYALICSFVGVIPGVGAAAEQQTPTPAPTASLPLSSEKQSEDTNADRSSDSTSAPGAGSVKKRVKTLADQRAEAARDHGAEFYNGNSLDFEGRDDDKNKRR